MHDPMQMPGRMWFRYGGAWNNVREIKHNAVAIVIALLWSKFIFCEQGLRVVNSQQG